MRVSAAARHARSSTSGFAAASRASSFRGAVAAIALVLERHLTAARKRRQRRKDVRELGLDVIVEHRDRFRFQALHVLFQRIHEDRERQVSLELRRRPRKHKVPALLRTSGELPEQPCLADPGLPYELDRGRVPLLELGEDKIERTELLRAPDEVIGQQGHLPPPRPA